MKNKKIYIAILCAYIISQITISILDKNNTINNSSSIRSTKSRGSLLISEYLENSGRKVDVNMTSLFRSEKIDEVDTLLILDPIYSLSELEIREIKDFVNEGGHLVLNSSGEHLKRVFGGLLKELKLEINVVEDEEFKNREIVSVSNEKYSASFYSLYNFEGCVVDKFGCYFYEKKLGRGNVSILLGVLPFSNVLLQETKNLIFLEQLLSDSKNILIDEFHHYYGSKTVWDLMKEPKLGFTVVVIFSLVIFFFIFSYVPKRLLAPTPKRNHFPNIHQLTLDLIAGGNEKYLSKDMMNKHKNYLAKEFDLDRQFLSKFNDPTDLIKFHKNKLKNR